MARSIIVEPQKLTTTATTINNQSSDYEKQYNLLFSNVDGLAAAWQGADNLAFVNQIKGFTDDFKQITALMRQYADFLNQSAKTYTNAQNDTISNAKRLTN